MINWRQSGHINDLRSVIAKFMGRDEPKHGATDVVIKAALRNPGQWMAVDGGALRIRVYSGVGTAHLEVHPDIAWRLNGILASIYPMAIPSRFREKPKKKTKEFTLMERPLPFAVVDLLAHMEGGWKAVQGERGKVREYIKNSLSFRSTYDKDKHILAEAEKVLESIGGTCIDGNWIFDYNPVSTIDEIICSGCIPDSKSHQFYPTPEELAEKAVALAEIGDSDTCLEPSAGQGGLARFMPIDRTLCIEISPLNASILEAKGYSCLTQDFLSWAGPKRDRIVMNSPFSEGRWQKHLEHAAQALNASGRLVAILPDSARGKELLDGFEHEWHGPYENMFAGTGVRISILVASHKS